MRNGMFLALAGLALLTGCDMANTPPTETPAPKWQPPYHLAFSAEAPKPNPAGVAIPSIGYTLATKEWERRAALVVRIDSPAVKNGEKTSDHLILAAVNIPGTGGNLPADYMDSAETQLGKLLADRCMKGNVKISVALVRSSIRPSADDAEIKAKMLSDWLPAEVQFKNPHPKC